MVKGVVTFCLLALLPITLLLLQLFLYRPLFSCPDVSVEIGGTELILKKKSQLTYQSLAMLSLLCSTRLWCQHHTGGLRLYKEAETPETERTMHSAPRSL